VVSNRVQWALANRVILVDGLMNYGRGEGGVKLEGRNQGTMVHDV